MIQSLRHKGLQRFFETGLKSGIHASVADKIRLILARLNVSVVAQDMDLPGLKLHVLKGKLFGFHAVSVTRNWRIIFRIENERVYEVDLVDYH